MKLSRPQPQEARQAAEAPAVDPGAKKAAHALPEAFKAQAHAPSLHGLAAFMPGASGARTVKSYDQPAAEIAPAVEVGMGKVQAFHASPVEGIEAFEPLSHFGSRAAAERRAEKYLREGAKVRLYEVDLDIQNPLKIPDLPRSAKVTGLHTAFRIAEQLYYDVKPSVLTDAERSAVIKAGQSGTDKECLVAILESKGYDGLVYKNKWEDPGSQSWIIFHPEQVHIHPR